MLPQPVCKKNLICFSKIFRFIAHHSGAISYITNGKSRKFALFLPRCKKRYQKKDIEKNDIEIKQVELNQL